MILKSEKNPTEREGIRKAHLKDAAAFCEFMAYFDDKVNFLYTYYFINYKISVLKSILKKVSILFLRLATNAK